MLPGWRPGSSPGFRVCTSLYGRAGYPRQRAAVATDDFFLFNQLTMGNLLPDTLRDHRTGVLGVILLFCVIAASVCYLPSVFHPPSSMTVINCDRILSNHCSTTMFFLFRLETPGADVAV